MSEAPNDLARLAGGLSEAQKRAVLWCHADGSYRVHDKQAPREVSFWVLLKVIKGDPLREVATMFSLTMQADHPTLKSGIWPARTWALTPLGQQVREYLKGQDNDR